MLTILIGKAIFNNIMTGEQKEFYRDYTDYWHSRLVGNGMVMNDVYGDNRASQFHNICFTCHEKNGTSSLVAQCSLRVGNGKEEYGAEVNKTYFILDIHKIILQEPKIA